MTMSASFSLKMMRIRIAVTDTGSISGKVTSQKPCQRLAPSTRAASCTSLGIAWRPASSMIIMNGMKVQASSAIDRQPWPDPRVGEEGGLSQPSQRASRATGPKRNSSIDLPIIQDTATGDSISGSRNATRKNFRARISALSSSARPKAMAYSDKMASAVPDHVAQGVPVERVAPHLPDVVEAVELPARQRGEVPVGQRDEQAEEQREDRQRHDEQHGRQHEQRRAFPARPGSAPASSRGNGPEQVGVERRPPVGEAEVGNGRVPAAICSAEDEGKQRRRAPDDRHGRGAARRAEMSSCGDDVEEIALAHGRDTGLIVVGRRSDPRLAGQALPDVRGAPRSRAPEPCYMPSDAL